MKIKFIKSPTGDPYKLAYNVGDEVNIKNDLAQELIEANIAEPVGKANKKKEEDDSGEDQDPPQE